MLFFLITGGKTETAVWRCAVKCVFLKISHISQKHTYAGVFFSNNAVEQSCSPETLFLTRFQSETLLRKRFQHRHFLVNFAKFLRRLFHRTPPGDCFKNCSKINQTFYRQVLDNRCLFCFSILNSESQKLICKDYYLYSHNNFKVLRKGNALTQSLSPYPCSPYLKA